MEWRWWPRKKKERFARDLTAHHLKLLRSEQDEEAREGRLERRKEKRVSGPRITPPDWHSEQHQRELDRQAGGTEPPHPPAA